MQSLVLQAGGLGAGLTTRPHKKEQVTKMLMNKNNIMDGHLSTTWAPQRSKVVCAMESHPMLYVSVKFVLL